MLRLQGLLIQDSDYPTLTNDTVCWTRTQAAFFPVTLIAGGLIRGPLEACSHNDALLLTAVLLMVFTKGFKSIYTLHDLHSRTN